MTARDSSLWGDVAGEVTVLRAVCEMIHTLTGQLSKFLRADSKRYPDDVLWDIVLEKASKAGLQDALRHALERVQRYSQA